MELLGNVQLGLETALSGTNLLYCFVGVFLGMVVGVIPGIGPLAAISMLFPISFYLPPTTALIMLGGIWYGSSYGGSITSILLNVPGTPQTAVACIDGHPMARQGRGGVALFMTTIASLVGGMFGIVLLMLFARTIAGYALMLGSAEYFSLMVLAMVGAAYAADGPMAKGLAMVALGVLIGIPGIDIYAAVTRFTFGMPSLQDGISLAALAMGLFGVGEIISSVRRINSGDIDRKSVGFKAMLPTRDDVRRSWFPMARGASIGAIIGVIPGTGSAMASFLSYAVERRVAKEPHRFGKGAIEGVVAPETANNAADQSAFIPTLALGIPGSPTMALMLGALMIHGIAPGPSLITTQPHLFWGLVMSFWIGNLILVILNIPLIGLWVRLLMIPYRFLYPAVLMFVCVGAFTLRLNPFDVWIVLFFGAIGYVLRVLEFSVAPLILGAVLGPLMEENFRRSMIVSQGELMFLLERPLSAIFLSLALFLILLGFWGAVRDWKRKRSAAFKT